MSRLTHDQKAVSLEAIRFGCTMQAGAKAAGVDVKALKSEMKRSAVFKKHIQEALEEGKLSAGDDSIQYLINVRDGKYEKTDRNRVTAAIALANWGKPGFRGGTTIHGRVEHDIRVITGVPRPRYEELPAPKVDNPPRKMLKSRRVEIKDSEGNWVATQHLEDVIEGEVIKESE